MNTVYDYLIENLCSRTTIWRYHRCIIFKMSDLVLRKCGIGVAPSYGEVASKSFLLAHKQVFVRLLMRVFPPSDIE